MSEERFGPILIALGLVLVLVGLIAWKGGLTWMGRLPGDLRITSHGIRLFIPLTSMLIVSVLLTIVLNLLRRLF